MCTVFILLTPATKRLAIEHQYLFCTYSKVSPVIYLYITKLKRFNIGMHRMPKGSKDQVQLILMMYRILKNSFFVHVILYSAIY